MTGQTPILPCVETLAEAILNMIACPNDSDKVVLISCFAALLDEAVRQAREPLQPSGLAPTVASKSTREGSIPSSVATPPTPRAQAEARLREKLGEYRRQMATVLCAPSTGRAPTTNIDIYGIVDAAEALLAAPPEPQAPPPDRAAWRAETGEAVCRYGLSRMSQTDTSDDPLRRVFALLDEPLRWPVCDEARLLRELHDELVDRRDRVRAEPQESPETARAKHMTAWSNGLNEAIQMADRLLLSRAASAAKENG